MNAVTASPAPAPPRRCKPKARKHPKPIALNSGQESRLHNLLMRLTPSRTWEDDLFGRIAGTEKRDIEYKSAQERELDRIGAFPPGGARATLMRHCRECGTSRWIPPQYLMVEQVIVIQPLLVNAKGKLVHHPSGLNIRSRVDRGCICSDCNEARRAAPPPREHAGKAAIKVPRGTFRLVRDAIDDQGVPCVEEYGEEMYERTWFDGKVVHREGPDVPELEPEQESIIDPEPPGQCIMADQRDRMIAGESIVEECPILTEDPKVLSWQLARFAAGKPTMLGRE